MRTTSINRDTLETQITVEINLDGTGASELDTGVPFLTTCRTKSPVTA